jgi:hypothetical protein
MDKDNNDNNNNNNNDKKKLAFTTEDFMAYVGDISNMNYLDDDDSDDDTDTNLADDGNNHDSVECEPENKKDCEIKDNQKEDDQKVEKKLAFTTADFMAYVGDISNMNYLDDDDSDDEPENEIIEEPCEDDTDQSNNDSKDDGKKPESPKLDPSTNKDYETTDSQKEDDQKVEKKLAFTTADFMAYVGDISNMNYLDDDDSDDETEHEIIEEICEENKGQSDNDLDSDNKKQESPKPKPLAFTPADFILSIGDISKMNYLNDSDSEEDDVESETKSSIIVDSKKEEELLEIGEPTGLCGFHALSKKFSVEDFKDFFGVDRFNRGWFDIEELIEISKTKNINLCVKRNGRVQHLFTDRRRECQIFLIENTGDYPGNHWSFVGEFSWSGVRLYGLTLLIILLKRYSKKISMKLSKSKNLKESRKTLLEKALTKENFDWSEDAQSQASIVLNGHMMAVVFLGKLKRKVLYKKSFYNELTLFQLFSLATIIAKCRRRIKEIPIKEGIVEDIGFSMTISEEQVQCCFSPKLISNQNFSDIILCIDQFTGKHPNLDCLFSCLDNCNLFLEVLNNSSILKNEASVFIKKYTHFRHDIFDYIFKTTVLKVISPFNSEKPISLIDSNKTPDYWDIVEDKVRIVEFTVVMNALRGNFMKGINKATSVYKREIQMLEDLGKNVVYYPIVLSLTETIEENVKVWEGYGLSVETSALSSIKELMSKIDFKYNYLLSYGFLKQTNRDFALAEEFISNTNIIEDNWRYVIIKVNKRLFYRMKKMLNETTIIENNTYRIRRAKNGNFYIISSPPDYSPNYTGQQFKRMLDDDYLFYKTLSSWFQGDDMIYIKTKEEISDVSTKPSIHCSALNETVLDAGNEFRIHKNLNMYSKSFSDSIDKVMVNNTIEGINTENNETEIIEGLRNYSEVLDSWSTTDNHPFNVINSPRRSFISYFDTEVISEIDYKLSVRLCKLNINDVNSNSARKLLTIKPKSSGEPVIESNDFENEKMEYRNASLHLYAELNKFNLQKIKIRNAMFLHPNPNMIKELHSKVKKLQSIYINKINSKTKKNLINLNKSLLEEIKKEMSWGTFKGYKLYMDEMKDIVGLIDDMRMATKSLKFNFILPENINDSNFMKSLKQDSLTDLNVYYKELSSSRLFQNAIFISRLAYTLTATSNQTFNNKYMYIDNLGLTDTCLMIKGGKKMTSTRKTKIFKLIYPCCSILSEWNPSIFVSDNITFDETPWMQLSQNVLQDMLALPYKLLSNYTYLRETNRSLQSFSILALPALLSFHNRRKTEILLHNMRYLCVNPLGDYSQTGKMLSEFGGPSYSAFDHAIKHGLKNNYLSFYRNIKTWSQKETNDDVSYEKDSIHHPFLNRNIYNVVDMTFVIYSTYLMSKGHYDQVVEQTNNMKSIIETHEFYMSKSTIHSYDITKKDNVDSIKEDDFGYSPEFSYQIGKLLSASLRHKHAANHMNIKWNNILTEPIDSMANNRGLRDQNKTFFGHKGYYVIYKKILENNFEAVTNILDMNLDERETHKHLRTLNYNFSNAQEKTPLDQVKFHVVDKSQRAGGREIYVMDYTTKLYQNPLEKMFKFICEFIDNEIISVSSARRAGLIHKKCFEYRNPKYKTYYMTLDCRKWAPRSNPDKYLYMLLGMRDVLPDDFVLSCIDYFIKHSKKKIYTRRHIVDKLLSNPEYSKYSKYFQNEEESESSWFTMPYSFVMGIFNMLSSLMHAGVQIYAKNILEPKILEQNFNVDFDMFAHSDDSGGRLSYDKDLPNQRVQIKEFIGNYEFIMKCANHLMSLKKCNISTCYFELLSILYMNHELLPLLPKFLGNISLNFTGSGLSSDMKQIVSKSIELLTNGASNSQAYQCQLILSNMYRNFYRVKTDTQIPALGGFANSWPAFYLAYGSAVDEVRVCYYNRDLYRKIITFATLNLDYELTDGTLNLKYKNIIRMPRGYKDFKDKIKLPVFENNEWFFQQNKTRHTGLNIFWFRSMLDSRNFAVAVMNINEIRKMLDSLYMAKGSNILGKCDNYSIEQLLLNIYNQKPEDCKLETTLRVMYSDLFKLLVYLEDFQPAKFSYSMSVTTKPCTLSMNSFVDTPISSYNSLHLATTICRPELLKYMYTNKTFGSELETMKKYLEHLDVHMNIIEVKNFLDFITKSKNEISSFYCNLPSNLRTQVGNQGLLNLVLNNHARVKRISNNNRIFIDKSKIQVNINDKAFQYILLYYFYLIFVRTKNDDIATIPVNKELTNGKTHFVNSIPAIVSKYYPYPDHLHYLKMIENDVQKSIILDNLNSWCLWEERQARLTGEWVGSGKFVIKLDNHYFTMSCLNRDIISVNHSSFDSIILSRSSAQYFMLLMQEFNLNYNNYINPEEGKLYFGLNNDGELGLHKGSSVSVGVLNTDYNKNIDNTIFKSKMTHTFSNGKHFIEYKSINKRINTMDELIFSKNRGKIFDTVEWDEISLSGRDIFMRSFFNGEFGSMPEIEFVAEDLVEKMTSTDIYKFFISSKMKGVSITKAIWDDIVVNMNSTEDIFPTLFENFGLKDLESILPKSKKDNLALYLYYDTDNESLRNLRVKLADIKNEFDRSNFIKDVITSIGDTEGVVKLPEIGDPAEFSKFKWDSLSNTIWYDACITICDAIYKGFCKLPDYIKLSVCKEHFIQITKFEDLVVRMFREQFSEIYKWNPNSKMLSNFSIMMHRLIELIHNDKIAFAEFARTFRKTCLRNTPRHPYYEQEWQELLAQAFKWLASGKKNIAPPSYATMYYKLNDIIEENFKIYHPTDDKNNSLIVPAVLKLNTRTLNVSNYTVGKVKITQKDLEDLDIPTFDMIQTYRDGLNNYTEIIEDCLDVHPFVQMKKRRKNDRIFLFRTIGEFISFLNQDISNRNVCIITPYLNANFNPKCVLIRDTKNNTNIMYAYNLSQESNLETFELTNSMKKMFDNYKVHYNKINKQLFSFEKKLIETNVKLDLDTQPLLENLSTFMNIESGDSYNSDLVLHLKDKFNLNDENTDIVEKITKMNITPIGKFQRIRKLITENMSKIDIKNEIDQVLKDVFEKNIGMDLNINKDKSLKLNLMKTERNSNKIIERMSNNKLEFKQANALLNNKYGGVITESITLPETIKENLVNNYKILMKQLRMMKMDDEYASCLVAIDLIKSVKQGEITTESSSFDEDLRNLLNIISSKVLQEDDNDDYLPEINHSLRPLNYDKRK